MALPLLELDDAPTPDPIAVLGVEELDRQHRVVLQRWRALEDAQLRGDHRAVRADLWFLERHASQHFAAEEQLMLDTSYPERARHCLEHSRFAERIRRLRLEVDGGREVTRAAHFGWIAEWLTRHVREVDGRLARFLAGRPAGGTR